MFNRKTVYGLTRQKIEQNWRKVFITWLVVGIISTVISNIILTFQISTALNIADIQYTLNLIQNNAFDPKDLLILFASLTPTLSPYSIIISLINTTICGVITISLQVALLKFVKEAKISIGFVFDFMFKNIKKVLIVSLLYSALITVVGYIPFVGFIISIIISYALAYYAYLIYEKPELGYIDVLNTSFSITSGHKFQLFLLDLHYVVRIWLPLVISLILVLVFKISALLIFGAIITCGAAIYYIPHKEIVKAVYFNCQLNGCDEEKEISE